MEINWTVVTYFVIGLFALNGFFRGWWKEAIVTVFLVLLVFLLQQPELARLFTDLLNTVFTTIWEALPGDIVLFLQDVFENRLGISTADGAPQIDPADGGAWLIILILFVGVAVLISRFGLPSWGRTASLYSSYAVTRTGSLLGGLVGALNGVLIIGLIREYLDGRRLPGGDRVATGVAMAGDRTVGTASARISLQAVEVPGLTILDSFLPWLFIAIGFLIFLAALKNRTAIPKDKDGFRKIVYKAPFGYSKIDRTQENG